MKQLALPIIGPVALAHFPDQGLSQVPAKVDTGADSSSIWATNIAESDGTLKFELFGPGSPFYSGQQVTTKQYVIRSVKNSFGQAEFRYKVPLRVRIGAKTIAARFTLADRANNAYPILIGRRTLEGKFLVDVSKRPEELVADRAKRILVLVNRGGPKHEMFYKKLNHESDHELEAVIAKYRDLAYYLDDGTLRIINILNGEDLRTFDFIYFKTSVKNAVFASVIAAYAERNLVPYADEAASLLASDSKLHQLAILGPDISVPDTIYMNVEHMQDRYQEIKQRLDSPFVLKVNSKHKGRGNYLITSKASLDKALASAKATNTHMIAQRFVPNDGYYRLVIMGKQVALVMHHRTDQTDTALTYKTEGPTRLIKPQRLPGDVIAMCITAADELGWQIASVDVLQDKKSGKWYCLEVNNSPQLAAGAFIDKKRAALAAFFLERT